MCRVSVHHLQISAIVSHSDVVCRSPLFLLDFLVLCPLSELYLVECSLVSEHLLYFLNLAKLTHLNRLDKVLTCHESFLYFLQKLFISEVVRLLLCRLYILMIFLSLNLLTQTFFLFSLNLANDIGLLHLIEL